MAQTQIKTWLGVVIIVVLAATAGAFVWLAQKNQPEIISPPIQLPINKGQKACTQEAKICPDGTSVGRTGPNCEFAQCPETAGIADKITITLPKKYEVISSPVSISGRARGTWFFEGSFPVEVYDENNKLLGSGAGEFSPSFEGEEWMTEDFVNFSGSIKFSDTSAASGYILFKKDNPSNIRALDESFKLPVKFENAGDCAKEGESIGAVYPGVVPKKCCDGLIPIVPKNIVGTQGICTKVNN